MSEKPNPVREQKWNSVQEALVGTNKADSDRYRKEDGLCWRCGRDNHSTKECYARTNADGKSLPAAPEKISGVKRKGTKKVEQPQDSDGEEEAPPPPAKKAKIAAVLDQQSIPSFPGFVELSETDESPSDF